MDCSREGAALIEQSQQRLAKQDQPDRGGDGQRDDGAQGFGQRAAQLALCAARREFGQGWEGDQPKCRADDRLRQLHGVPAPLHRADTAWAQPRGQVGHGHQSQLEHRQVENARNHQHPHPAHGRRAQVQHRPPAKAVVDQGGHFDQEMQQRTDDRADGQAGHTHGGRQEQRARGDAQRIERCAQGGQQEVLEPVQHAALHRADAEDDGRDQHDAHDLDSLGLLGR